MFSLRLPALIDHMNMAHEYGTCCVVTVESLMAFSSSLEFPCVKITIQVYHIRHHGSGA